MPNKTLLALGVIGAGVATYLILDQQNLLPWANNSQKQWLWQRVFPSATIARASSLPLIFTQPQPQQAMPVGVIIPPTQVTSVSTTGRINGRNASIDLKSTPKMVSSAIGGKYRQSG